MGRETQVRLMQRGLYLMVRDSCRTLADTDLALYFSEIVKGQHGQPRVKNEHSLSERNRCR